MAALTKKTSMKTCNVIIADLFEKGYPPCDIIRVLRKEHGIQKSRMTIYRFLKRYREEGVGAFHRRRKAIRDGRLKIRSAHKKFISYHVKVQPDISAKTLCVKLRKRFGLCVSVKTVVSLRKSLGFRGKYTRYCQIISGKNQRARLLWSLRALRSKEKFEDVVFTDETRVEMSANGLLHFSSGSPTLDCQTSKRPKPKHSYKVNVWGGISYRGRTHICIFTGVMDSIIYQKILEDNLLPFTDKVFPEGFRLYQDNDSKHCSKSTKEWMTGKNILKFVMDTPASSPDLNPIENVWAAMKFHLQNTVKPRTKDELVNGIKNFWESLDVVKCAKFIDHIHKVIPHVILNSGGPTKF